MNLTGNHLRAARALAGLDQEGLSELSGVSVNTVRNMEACGAAAIGGYTSTREKVRGALEGLAARLLATRTQDVQPLELALEMMRRASKERRPAELLDADLKFHLELCRLSNNPYVFDHAKRVLLPVFAFARIRVISSGQDTSVWSKDFDAHQRIVDLVKEGQGEVAEAYVRRAMARFASTAYDNWEKKPAIPGRRARQRSGARVK